MTEPDDKELPEIKDSKLEELRSLGDLICRPDDLARLEAALMIESSAIHQGPRWIHE